MAHYAAVYHEKVDLHVVPIFAREQVAVIYNCVKKKQFQRSQAQKIFLLPAMSVLTQETATSLNYQFV